MLTTAYPIIIKALVLISNPLYNKTPIPNIAVMIAITNIGTQIPTPNFLSFKAITTSSIAPYII